ncbi:MAG: YfhE family protein [Paenisporosarcina sp.]
MAKNREPHEKMTTQSNGLTKTQEVLYQEEFKKADSSSNEKKIEASNKKSQ